MPADVTRATEFPCPTCHKTFSTKSHLSRHRATHTRTQAHRCPFCAHEFTRFDVLRRHSRNCDQRGTRNAVPEGRRGRKQQACSFCRYRRTRCDGDKPCKRCISNQTRCVYPGEETSIEDQDGPNCLMPVLLSITDSSLSVTEMFAAADAYAGPVSEYAGYYASSLMFDGENSDSFSSTFFIDGPPITPASTPQMAVQDIRLAELLTQLVSRYELNRVPQAWTTPVFPTALTEMVFTAPNVTDYISFYFQRFHPNSPLLHRPIFNANKVELSLLLAVAICGSVFAPPRDHVLSARSLVGLAEDYIFGTLHERLDILRERNCQGNDRDLEILQAAAIMLSIRCTSSEAKTRHRLQAKRHPDLIAFARLLRITSAQRTCSFQKTNWQQFVNDELQIRLIASVLIVDCQWTIYFNNPPQITMAELLADLPCADTLFEAPTADEFAKLALDLTNSSSTSPPCIKDCLALLLQESLSEPEFAILPSVEARHLMILMFAIHSTIFVSRTNLLISSTYVSLIRAINRWEKLWKTAFSNYKESNPSMGAFTKMGVELCWLAKKILELSQSRGVRCRYLSEVPTDGLEDLHKFIQTHAGTNTSTL